MKKPGKAVQRGAKRMRRVFSAEFKQEAVRRMRERRATGVSLAHISRRVVASPGHQQQAAHLRVRVRRESTDEHGIRVAHHDSFARYADAFLRKSRSIHIVSTSRCKRRISSALLDTRPSPGKISATGRPRSPPPAALTAATNAVVHLRLEQSWPVQRSPRGLFIQPHSVHLHRAIELLAHSLSQHVHLIPA